MALKGNLSGVLGGANLASQLKKLQGKGFANFIAKQSDELIKALCTRVLDEIFAVCRKCAKFTHVRADIGRIYVAIYVKKYLFAVQFSPFGVCEFTQRKKV